MKITGPGESSLLLLKIIRQLKTFKIPYAIVGAFAASFYGVVRASLDADAVISIDGHEEKRDQLRDCLRKEGLKVMLRRGDWKDPIHSVMNIEDKFHNRVDLLMGIRGMDPGAFRRTVQALFMGARVTVIGIEDFIAMKIFAGSPKDIQDAVGVLRVSGKKVNRILLKKLVRGYGNEELGKLKALLKEDGRARSL